MFTLLPVNFHVNSYTDRHFKFSPFQDTYKALVAIVNKESAIYIRLL